LADIKRGVTRKGELGGIGGGPGEPIPTKHLEWKKKRKAPQFFRGEGEEEDHYLNAGPRKKGSVDSGET